MKTSASIDRFRNEWHLLARLAEWLRTGRADRYDDMIARGQIDANDAFRDRVARAVIAADWRAIADRATRADEPSCQTGWCVWALEQALAVQQRRLDRLAPSDGSRDDHLDLRDAIACLLDHYRTGLASILLAPLRGASKPADREAA